jgi:hypothetical protein
MQQHLFSEKRLFSSAAKLRFKPPSSDVIKKGDSEGMKTTGEVEEKEEEIMENVRPQVPCYTCMHMLNSYVNYENIYKKVRHCCFCL